MTDFIPTPFTKNHPLRWPIDDDKGQPLKQVTMRTLPLGQVREIRIKHQLDDGTTNATDAQLEAFIAEVICLASGLTEAERGRLCSPDYNSLKVMSRQLTIDSSAAFKLMPGGADDIPLLVPVDDIEKGVITAYQLQPPTVKATELVNAQHSGFEREVQLAAICAGLDVSTIRSLHMPDWVHLQKSVTDFLDEPAAFYPSPTSNA